MTVPSARINYPGQPISSVNTPQTVQLKSGQVFYLPNGNYLVKPGPQSSIQYQDDNSGLWRTLDADYPGGITVNSDGNNFRVINISGSITGVLMTAAGTLYNQANATVTFGAPVAGGVTAAGTPIVGGSLTFAITPGGTGGTGYTMPILLIPAPFLLGGTPGLCIPASANLTLSTGVISAIVVGFAGAGYLNAPGAATVTITPVQFQANPSLYINGTNMVIIDPTGSGASITATVANGTPSSGGITGVVLNNNGALYDGTHIPSVTFSGTTGSGATATALPSFSLTSVTVAGTNTGYSGTPMGQSGLGVVSAQVFDETVLPRAARVVFSLTTGAISGQTIEDAGSGFQAVPAFAQFVNAGSNATFTPVVGGVTNTLIYWQVG